MTTKEQAYQQAIDILTGNIDSIGYREIVIRIAKQYPEVLVAVVNNTPINSETETPEWVKLVELNTRRGEIISAIKTLRGVTGLSLLQAKNVIRGLETYMNTGHFDFNYTETIKNLYEEQYRQVKMLQDYIKVY